MAYEHRGEVIQADEEGYLLDVSQWDPELALVIAQSENIKMGSDHWEGVNFLRRFYEKYRIAPAMRVLTKAIGKSLGPGQGNSRYLYRLFPKGPAVQACKIAGLPKPVNCI